MTDITCWTVENGKLVAYERQGECNRCGQCCCTHTIRFRQMIGTDGTNRDHGKRPDGDWSEYEGWHVFRHHGAWWYLKIVEVEDTPGPCCMLGADNKCLIWQDETEFPPICRYWPFHPSNLEWYPECSFTFERIAEEVVA